MLVWGTVGILQKIKDLGFETFDNLFDESYDKELDSDLRIIKIANEVRRLCSLPKHELDQMYQEMQEVLEYNFNWFYNGFKEVLVNELVDNYKRCLINYNPQISENFFFLLNRERG